VDVFGIVQTGDGIRVVKLELIHKKARIFNFQIADCEHIKVSQKLF